ncbi:hypothetical protein AMV251 [Betaentomopoxvirus amoorei]|uniref:AMV251 n=1 Tax=Amsacta moorei entomopoxvirus TaxID=28321 RepID=Q9EMF5_AMEPV|nr:hypothetical protein AMV251 [Amsacta moorei entomopoxvirus]AAG02957.1 AMV251 [Amsacta moorei entomopoxvirus]
MLFFLQHILHLFLHIFELLSCDFCSLISIILIYVCDDNDLIKLLSISALSISSDEEYFLNLNSLLCVIIFL